MRLLLLVTVAGGFITPIAAGGQSRAYRPRMAGVGARVQLEIADRVLWSPLDRPLIVRRAEGAVRVISPDTLYLELADSAGAVAIPRMLIQSVKVSLGPPSRGKSALEVGGYGALILALIFQGENVNRNRRFGSSWRAATIGAGAGFIVGGLIGAVHPYERWRFAWIPE